MLDSSVLAMVKDGKGSGIVSVFLLNECLATRMGQLFISFAFLVACTQRRRGAICSGTSKSNLSPTKWLDRQGPAIRIFFF